VISEIGTYQRNHVVAVPLAVAALAVVALAVVELAVVPQVVVQVAAVVLKLVVEVVDGQYQSEHPGNSSEMIVEVVQVMED